MNFFQAGVNFDKYDVNEFTFSLPGHSMLLMLGALMTT